MATRQVSSRLARHEQRKMIRQTVMMIGATIILLVAFIFIILPQSVNLVGRFTGANIIFNPGDTIAPQVPVLSAPPTATPSAQVKISGYGEAKSEVVMIVNASEQSRQMVADDGQFSFELTLSEGQNTISAYAIDEAKNESDPSRTYSIVMDDQAPKLDVTEPQDGQQIELRKNQQVIVKGQTDPMSRVYVNGRLASTQADGTFSTTHQLIEGENNLKIRAEDQAGNVSEKEIKVNFKL